MPSTTPPPLGLTPDATLLPPPVSAPTGDAPRSRTHRVLRGMLIATIPLAAIAVAWWMTREPPATAVAAAHAHAGATPSTKGAQPVSLTVDQARRIGVTFAPVTSSALPREIRAVGLVTFDETRLTTIAPKIDGWVERLYVDFTGRAVSRGEPLMAVYSPMLVTAQEELLLARRLAGELAGGEADARDGAADMLASARRRLAYWDVPAEDIARIERSGQVQRTITLRAPASGVVVEKTVTAGQRVMAGDALFRIADLRTVWIEGDVYERDLGAIRMGQVTTAAFDAYPGEQWTGRISYIYPTLAPETRTARIRVALANPGLRLKPGMYATLHVAGRHGTAPVLTVPRGAVLATGERALVFVRGTDGRLEPRVVQLGASSDDRIEILRGVTLGDTVVASATFLVDAESNLGTALGGMGDMPGMEVTVPPRPVPAVPRPTVTPPPPRK